MNKTFDASLNKINLIVIGCIFASLFAWNQEPELVMEYLAFSGENLFHGKVWTLLTALFVHGDPVHLLGNMLFLFVFGNTLEKEVETKRTFSVFFTGGALSFLLSLPFYDPTVSMIGASAAIFTLTAIVMLINPLKFSFLFLMPQGLVAIIYFTYNVIAVYTGIQGNIAYISHIIGFLIGIPFGMAWSESWAKNLLITIALFLIYFIIIFYILPIALDLLL